MSIEGLRKAIEKDIKTGTLNGIAQLEDVQTSLQRRARKLLLLFFLIMAGITFLSKAVDSVTVARVVTDNSKADALTYTFTGNGTVKADEIKYIRLPEGLGIDRVYVYAGQKIKKGETLLAFHSSDVSEALETAENVMEKLDIQMKQEGLEWKGSNGQDTAKAELLYQNSAKDITTARSNLQLAKDIYEAAVKAYKNANRKTKEEIYEEKLEEYNDAKDALESVGLDNVNLLEQASRKLDLERKNLENLKSSDNMVLEALSSYCCFYDDPVKAMIAKEDLFTAAYGSEAYKEHQQELEELRQKINWAQADLSSAQSTYEEALGLEMLMSSYKKAIMLAKRALEEANANYQSATSRDNNIMAAMELYVISTRKQDNDSKEQAVKSLFQEIYGKSGYQKHQEEISEAEENLDQAEKDSEITKKKCDLSQSVAQDKCNRIKKDLGKMKAGTYDDQNRIESYQQKMETAKQELIAAKNALETANRNNMLQKLERNDGIRQQKYEREAELLKKQSIALDWKQQQRTVEKLKKLKAAKGLVKAQFPGVVEEINLEAGSRSSAETGINISTGGYSIVLTLPKEQGDKVYEGDIMSITKRGEGEAIKTGVKSIRAISDDGGEELTQLRAALPKGNYRPGEILKATLESHSAMCNICIPIMALRWDSYGSFVLVAKPKQTVLGKVLLAERVPVEVIDKDNTTAAVSGILYREDDVIVSSSKNISEGDRVRKNSE